MWLRVFLLRCLVFIVLKLRVYYIWSKIYQRFFEKWPKNRYKKMRQLWDEINFTTLEEVESVIGKMHWQKDGIFQLGDAISDPKATYFRHVNGIDGALDCDDMSLFAATAIKDMASKGRLLDKGIWPDKVFLLSVPWVDEKGKVGGHNICVFCYAGADGWKWAHISNWFGGRVAWNFDSLEDILGSILITRISIGYGLATPELKLVKYGWGTNV
ncbi:MAG: hypothetical protein ACTSW7_03775 [Candidatus Thorarchaeota archaeon]